MTSDFGYALRTGKRGDLRYWYHNPSTGKLYEGPKPSARLVSAKPQRIEHPPTVETETSPWVDVSNRNHELIAIPGPPEVLYNKLGLTSADDLHPREGLGVMRSFKYLQDNVTATTPMTVAWLKKLHRLAFEDLYTWAGIYRTVQVSKGGKHPFSGWCLPQFIEPSMEQFEKHYLRQLTPTSRQDEGDVPRRVAILISEFLLIHPFREGNGRIAQMMGNWVALQAGLPTINYGIDEDSEKKEAYILALHKGYNQDYAPLERFVQEGIERSQRVLRRLKLEPSPPEESDSAHE